MTPIALAVASALAALFAALLFAIRARYFERVLEATELALRNISRRCRVPCETPYRARIVSLAFLDVLRFHAPAELGRAIFSPVPLGIHPLPLDLAIIYRENEWKAMAK